ncbi:DUF488 domain-containing protein [Nocardioides sp. Y6]|uniref:DUF488 domain-containing protein n=1 Tax=Nocardioides malaquae TaxID=2773426 RepID=A0ABR9RUH1_9ACTN|nr:DUF488 domain-containing protein [Nocardioides malaquae]
MLTAGHGTAGREGLTALFLGAGVGRVVDVRRFPGSRRNADVGSEAMAGWLAAAGVDYVWEPRLGGRRRLPKGPDVDPDADAWWRVEAFRAYAAHTRSEEFAQGLRAVLSAPPPQRAARQATLLMCSESVWWRCHRRLISDVLTLVHGTQVLHLAHDGRTSVHEPSEGAVVEHGHVRYPASS